MIKKVIVKNTRQRCRPKNYRPVNKHSFCFQKADQGRLAIHYEMYGFLTAFQNIFRASRLTKDLFRVAEIELLGFSTTAVLLEQ